MQAARPQDASLTRGVDYLVIWRTIRKHWATALAVFALVCLLVTFYTLGQTPIYRASSLLLIDPQPPRPLGKGVDMVVDIGSGNYWNNREYNETQYKIIQSMRVATVVVVQLNLHHDSAFMKNVPGTAPTEGAGRSPEDAAEVLRSRIRVEPVKDSRLAMVHYEDADPMRAQRVLSALMDAYLDQHLDFARTSTSTAVDWLRQQTEKLKEELEGGERALHAYKRDKSILSLDLDAQSNMLREEMKKLNDELISVRAKREAITAQRSELVKIKADDPSDLPAHELLANPTVQQLRQRYEDAVRERAGLEGAGRGVSHPDVAAATSRVAVSRAALLAEVRNVQRAVDRDLAVTKKQEAGLARLFDGAQRRALELNSLEVDYNRLRRARDNTEKLYSVVLERTKESDLARMISVSNIRVVDRAMQPRQPVKPRVGLNIALGALGGIALGIAAALGRALMDRTIKTPEDVETELGLVCLGLLPEIGGGLSSYTYGRAKKHRRRGKTKPENPELIVHEAPTSGVAEAARAIRTNLLFMSPDAPLRTLLVTSPAPSEGKTTVATSIAIAMAQTGQRVVLIDCDLRRPRVHRVFKHLNDRGVTTTLLDQTPLEACVLETQVPNLSVIMAGPVSPNPAELFHSERFRAYLRDVSQRFDRVIIDSPPAVTVTDAVVLSTLVDGVVLVARAFSTTKDLARQVVRALSDVGRKPVGMVLNAVNLDRHEYRYYYYYGRDGAYSAETGDGAGDPHVT